MEYVEPIRDRKKINAIKKILKATNLRNYCLFTLESIPVLESVNFSS